MNSRIRLGVVDENYEQKKIMVRSFILLQSIRFNDTYSNKGVEGGGGACVLGCGGGDGETVGSGVCCLPPNIILYCTE